MKFLVLVFISVFILGVVSVNAQSWDQIIKTCASDRQADDNFGCSVSIDG